MDKTLGLIPSLGFHFYFSCEAPTYIKILASIKEHMLFLQLICLCRFNLQVALTERKRVKEQCFPPLLRQESGEREGEKEEEKAF